MVGLTLWLGSWQLGRADEKRARQATLEARMHDTPVRLAGSVAEPGALLYRRVRAAGRWMPERQFFVDNRIHEGRAGFDVITPFALEGGAAVLVNRGWVARGGEYPRAPNVPAPTGFAEISGLATLPPARFLELSGEVVEGDVWQNLSIERVAARMGLALLPVVILEAPAGPGLAAVREQPDARVEKHVEYAFTWFALAATAAALWLALNFRRLDR